MTHHAYLFMMVSDHRSKVFDLTHAAEPLSSDAALKSRKRFGGWLGGLWELLSKCLPEVPLGYEDETGFHYGLPRIDFSVMTGDGAQPAEHLSKQLSEPSTPGPNSGLPRGCVKKGRCTERCIYWEPACAPAH